MLLSEMFGVERDTDFCVEMFEGKFRIMSSSGRERLYFKSEGGDWGAVTAAWMLYGVIESAPSGIIRLPPPLTDEQRVVLMSLFTMGARYMGASRDGWKRCFVNKPQKEFSGWTCGDAQCLTIAPGMSNCLDSLVSWPDPEPFDIAKALGVEK